MPLTAIFWPFLGVYALFVLIAVEGAAFWMIETRTRTGLELRRYQRFVDMRKSISGSFIMCGEVIDPHQNVFGYVVDSSTRGRPETRPNFVIENPSGGRDVTDSRRRRMVLNKA